MNMKFHAMFLCFWAMLLLILSSCNMTNGLLLAETRQDDCSKEIIVTTQIKIKSPSIGPISIGIVDSGIEIEESFPGVDIEHHIGPPPTFKGFNCLILIINNNIQDSFIEKAVIYFEENSELRVGIQSDVVTEYIFNSDRMTVSPGSFKPSYMEYDYLANTLTIDTQYHKIEYLFVAVDSPASEETLWFCSRYLDNGKFVHPDLIVASWFRDVAFALRGMYLLLGSVFGTLLFWASFIVIVVTSIIVGLRYIENKVVGLSLFIVLIPLVSSAIMFHAYHYASHMCPVV